MDKKIVGYAYVVGDILHRGHLLHLRNCKSLCDFLIVGVLSKEACLEVKPAPTIPLDERLEIISNLKNVDMAVCQDEYSPLNNCKAIKPDILFESVSHKEMPANNYITSVGGRVFCMPYYSKQSSTKIKEKIKGEQNEKV
jgi:glycerol-3-phosphate cytidylyltransferase